MAMYSFINPLRVTPLPTGTPEKLGGNSSNSGGNIQTPITKFNIAVGQNNSSSINQAVNNTNSVKTLNNIFNPFL